MTVEGYMAEGWHRCDGWCTGVCVSDGGGGAMPDGRPRGSFNRWNYNEVYRAATPAPPSVTARDAVSDAVGGGRGNESSSHYQRWRQSHKYRTTQSTSPAPTPGSRVDQDAKRDVDWAYDAMSFYLRVCVAERASALLHL